MIVDLRDRCSILENMHIKDTPARDRLMRQLLQVTGENTKAGAVDVAIKHYLEDLATKRRLAPQLTDEIVGELSTPWLPMSE